MVVNGLGSVCSASWLNPALKSLYTVTSRLFIVFTSFCEWLIPRRVVRVYKDMITDFLCVRNLLSEDFMRYCPFLRGAESLQDLINSLYQARFDALISYDRVVGPVCRVKENKYDWSDSVVIDV